MIYEQVYFLGTGRVGADCLRILAQACGERLVCLAVEKEHVPTMRQTAARLGVPFHPLTPEALPHFLCARTQPTLLVSAHNSYLFPRKVVAHPPLTLLNFHNAYLPDYRGRNAPTWEIYRGEIYGGATWHIIAADVDTGAIAFQERVPITPDMTALELLMATARTGVRLFRQHIDEILAGTYPRRRITAPGRLYLSREVPNDGWFDPTWSMTKAYAFLRALDYGGLPILPPPKLRLGEGVYEIEDYQIGGCPIGGGHLYHTVPSADGRSALLCRLRKLPLPGR